MKKTKVAKTVKITKQNTFLEHLQKLNLEYKNNFYYI